MFEKKGVSDVVTIVLTVMITIAAIGIIWAAVIPMIRTNLIDSSACNDVDISIDLDSGYTCNDEIKGYALVQVNKGPAQVNITELNFFVSSAGNSYSSTIGVNLAPGASEAILVPTSTLKNISKISVVPVVRSGNKLQQCKESYIEVVKSCSLSQEDFTKYRKATSKDLPEPDTTAPAMVFSFLIPGSGNACPQVTDNSINVAWVNPSSTLDESFEGVKLYKNNTLVITRAEEDPTGTYTFSGLNPSTTYNLSIETYDAAGNTNTSRKYMVITTRATPCPTGTS